MATGKVDICISDSVGTVQLSNPAKLNALTVTMWRQLTEGMQRLDADTAVRVVVIEGDGAQAFAAGADLSEADFGRGNAAVHSEMVAASSQAYLAVQHCSKPVIAKIRGVCMGGGLGLAAACDLRVCSNDARFRMPAALLGLGYPLLGVQRFVEVMGAQATVDIFLTARTFDAEEALRIGLVSRVVGAGDIDDATNELARSVSEQAPLTLRALKLAVQASLVEPAQRNVEAVQAAIDACFASADLQEGTRAFQEKRKPRFAGA